MVVEGRGEGAGGVTVNEHGAGWPPLEATRVLWNETKALSNNTVKEPKATELYTLKWLILCYMNFTSIF